MSATQGPIGAADERAFVTPEGVDLRVRLGAVSERAAAVLIDLCIILLALIILTLLLVGPMVLFGDGRFVQATASVIWLLGFFVLRAFYFTAFEAGPRGATPGKRIMKLRVASRDGGVLGVERIVARNAVREIEIYLPISFLFSRGTDIDAVLILCGAAWCLVFLLFPLLNRDRLRLGDVIAGTWVLRAPRPALLADLAAAPAFATIRFTDAELDHYGVKELQVLERVLRDAEPDALAIVARSIRDKIGRPDLVREEDRTLLSAYYKALRQRLEQRLLLGVRKRDKHDT